MMGGLGKRGLGRCRAGEERWREGSGAGRRRHVAEKGAAGDAGMAGARIVGVRHGVLPGVTVETFAKFRRFGKAGTLVMWAAWYA
jgi:hypothetical protein